MADVKTYRPQTSQVTQITNEAGNTVIQTGDGTTDAVVRGDIAHTDGTVVLNIHGDQNTPATFTGDVLNADGTIVVNVGSDTETAEFNGNLPYSSLTGTVPTWNQDTTGQAGTIANQGALATLDTVDYNLLSGTVPTWNQDTTGNAATVSRIPATENNNMQVDGTALNMKVVSIPQADYNDITIKEANTLYLITAT